MLCEAAWLVGMLCISEPVPEPVPDALPAPVSTPAPVVVPARGPEAVPEAVSGSGLTPKFSEPFGAPPSP